MDALSKLIEVSSPALGSVDFDMRQFPEEEKNTANALRPLLAARNGFCAFDSALHVYGTSSLEEPTIFEWNSLRGWKEEYGDLASGAFAFAEDLFGNQFCIFHGEFVLFNIETACTTRMGVTAEDWADTLLSDVGYWTGFQLASEWQELNGPIPFGKRLFPRRPFLLGGEYDVSNLWLGDVVNAIGFYGFIARHTASLSDGTHVEIDLPGGSRLAGIVQR